VLWLRLATTAACGRGRTQACAGWLQGHSQIGPQWVEGLALATYAPAEAHNIGWQRLRLTEIGPIILP
jgi:hypothetical protein